MLRGRERERLLDDKYTYVINISHTRDIHGYLLRTSSRNSLEKNRTDTSNFCNPNYRDSTIGPKKIESSVSLMDFFQLNSTFEHSVACSNLH